MKRLTRFVILGLVALHLSACYWWEPTTLTPPQVIEAESPSQVRLTRLDGEQVTIRDPVMRADSIAGQAGREPVSVAVSDVQLLDLMYLQVGQTIGSVLLGAIVATALIAPLFCCL